MVTNGERDWFKSARSFPTMTVPRNPPHGWLERTKMLPVIAGGNIAVTRVAVPGQRERKERRNVHSSPMSLNRDDQWASPNSIRLSCWFSIFILAPGQEDTGSKRSIISRYWIISYWTLNAIPLFFSRFFLSFFQLLTYIFHPLRSTSFVYPTLLAIYYILCLIHRYLNLSFTRNNVYIIALIYFKISQFPILQIMLFWNYFCTIISYMNQYCYIMFNDETNFFLSTSRNIIAHWNPSNAFQLSRNLVSTFGAWGCRACARISFLSRRSA